MGEVCGMGGVMGRSVWNGWSNGRSVWNGWG